MARPARLFSLRLHPFGAAFASFGVQHTSSMLSNVTIFITSHVRLINKYIMINKKGPPNGEPYFVYMARPARFERATARFVAEYSIQLSYGRFLSMRTIHGYLLNSNVLVLDITSNLNGGEGGIIRTSFPFSPHPSGRQHYMLPFDLAKYRSAIKPTLYYISGSNSVLKGILIYFI